MIRLIAVIGFALSIATSAQAMAPAPIPQIVNDEITQIAAAWSGQDPSQRRMRGKDHHPSNPPRRSPMCAMAAGCLRHV
jgi:hypothetical protein